MSFLSQPVQTIFTQPTRKIGSITVQTVISESTNDTLTVTKQPVQIGASITDHAYSEPTAFSTTIYFKDNSKQSLKAIYQSLLDLQSSRVPITITTPKRIYDSMLITSLGQTTERTTENCLAITLTAQQIIIVQIATANVPRSKLKNAGTNGGTSKAGQKSFLATAFDGAKAFLSGAPK